MEVLLLEESQKNYITVNIFSALETAQLYVCET